MCLVLGYSFMRRYEISDQQWEVVGPLLSGKASDCGVTAKDNRLFFNAVLWVLHTGAPWADLPERFGLSNSVCRRFRRLAQKWVWERLFLALQAPALGWVMLDSTILRAHQHAAGQKKRCGHRMPRQKPRRAEYENSRLCGRAGQRRSPAHNGWPGQ